MLDVTTGQSVPEKHEYSPWTWIGYCAGIEGEAITVKCPMYSLPLHGSDQTSSNMNLELPHPRNRELTKGESISLVSASSYSKSNPSSSSTEGLKCTAGDEIGL
jgi:hypothetical protein